MDAKRLEIEPEDWQIHAACKGRQELFFPPDDESESRVERRRREGRAKTVCLACVVRIECLTEAVTAGERFGIWGGMTERERRAAANRGSFEPPPDIAGPGRPARLPAVVVQGRPMSPVSD